MVFSKSSGCKEYVTYSYVSSIKSPFFTVRLIFLFGVRK